MILHSKYVILYFFWLSGREFQPMLHSWCIEAVVGIILSVEMVFIYKRSLAAKCIVTHKMVAVGSNTILPTPYNRK